MGGCRLWSVREGGVETMRDFIARNVFAFSSLMLIGYGEGLAEKIFIGLLIVAIAISGGVMERECD